MLREKIELKVWCERCFWKSSLWKQIFETRIWYDIFFLRKFFKQMVIVAVNCEPASVTVVGAFILFDITHMVWSILWTIPPVISITWEISEGSQKGAYLCYLISHFGGFFFLFNFFLGSSRVPIHTNFLIFLKGLTLERFKSRKKCTHFLWKQLTPIQNILIYIYIYIFFSVFKIIKSNASFFCKV